MKLAACVCEEDHCCHLEKAESATRLAADDAVEGRLVPDKGTRCLGKSQQVGEVEV